jgi:predicted amidohydrolase YtcJ
MYSTTLFSHQSRPHSRANVAFRCAVLLVAGFLLLSARAGAAPSLILHHGRIVTVDDRFSIVEAVAVTGDRVSAVGRNDDILSLKDGTTELVDLKGAMVLPGLMDSHSHPVGAATTEFDHPIPDIEDIASLLAYIKDRTRVVPEGSLIGVSQVFITRLREQRYPTKDELDSVAPRHPVAFRTGPDTMLNSLALQLAGIDSHFALPEGSPGRVERDENGNPTGLVRTFSPKIKAPAPRKNPSEDETLELVRKLFADYNSVGFTTIADRGASKGNIAVYSKLRDTRSLSVRLRLSHTFSTGAQWRTTELAIEEIASHPLREPDSMLQIIGTKVWLDGGMLTGSAFMEQPWGVSKMYGISDPSYRGVQQIPTETLQRMVRTVASKGMQFTAHSVGDAAVATLLGVYEEVSRELPLRDTRPCITHCNFMSPDSIAKASRLGAVIDLQPVWFHLDGATLLKQFGEERLKRFQPLRALFDAGVPVGGGSDHMQKIGSLRSINPYNPWLGMWIAVSRKCRSLESPLHPEGGLSRREAIQMFTINNARILLMEREAGSLEPGKLADMVLIDRDVLECPIDELAGTRVLKTWLGGKSVFSADGAGRDPVR